MPRQTTFPETVFIRAEAGTKAGIAALKREGEELADTQRRALAAGIEALRGNATPLAAPDPHTGEGDVAGDGALAAGGMLAQGAALARHLRLLDGRVGNVAVGSDRFFVNIRGRWPDGAERVTEWGGLPVEWKERAGEARALATSDG